MDAGATVPSKPWFLSSERAGWVRGPSFDLTLIIGAAALAVASGLIVGLRPDLFPFVLFLDVWFLGYHHVIATYTRLVFDSDSLREYRHLVTWVPVAVAAISVFALYAFGAWLLATTYFYWQWFHYTRQSYGIARVYQLKAGLRQTRWDTLIVYLIPFAGILHRSAGQPEKFIGMRFWAAPVPPMLANFVLGVAIVLSLIWCVQHALGWLKGKVPTAYLLYMYSHLGIFFVGYVAISTLDFGWLVLNIWHNTQYVLFVWHFHNRRFRNQTDPKHLFLSRLTTNENVCLYFGFCLLLSTAFYFGVERLLRSFNVGVLSVVVLFFMVVNFHHYIVDAIIWRVRKAPVRQDLGLDPVP